jgi:hypothetical protein
MPTDFSEEAFPHGQSRGVGFQNFIVNLTGFIVKGLMSKQLPLGELIAGFIKYYFTSLNDYLPR